MGFPSTGSCPQHQAHTICCVTSRRHAFIADQSCNICNTEFDDVHFKHRILSPHYYHCKKCNVYICFNCARDANSTNKNWQQSSDQLPSRRQQPIKNKVDRLKLNDLFENSNDNALDKYLKKIIKLFGGNMSMLHFITRNATSSQLQSIHKMVLKQQIKYKHNIIHKQYENGFDLIPSECTKHICGYLEKDDIKKFKCSSRKIAIICYEEMKKIGVMSINGNEVLNNTQIDAHSLDGYVSETRYHCNKTFDSLQHALALQYGILPNNQLIFQLIKSYQTYDCKLNLLNMNNLSKKYIKGCQNKYKWREKSWYLNYLVIDKMKTVIFNGDQAKSFDIKYDLYKELRHYQLLILRYFDIMHQKINVVQYILFQKNKFTVNALFKYIEHNFIEIEGVDNKWYPQLTDILKQMNNDGIQPKLRIYQHNQFGNQITYYSANKILKSTDIMLTFQINNKHSWYKANETIKFSKIRTKCKKEDVVFVSNANQFCKNIKTVSVEMKLDKHVLIKCINYYYENRLSSEEKELFKYDIQSILDLANISEHAIKISSGPFLICLKKKMSQIFGNIIHPKYFEFTGFNHYLLKGNGNNYNYLCFCHIIWESVAIKNVISPYTFINDQHLLVTVKIFAPSHCPYPYQFAGDVTKSITFPYFQQFQVDVFIEEIFNMIRRSSDHILMDNVCKKLVDLYYDDTGNDDNDNDDDSDMNEVE